MKSYYRALIKVKIIGLLFVHSNLFSQTPLKVNYSVNNGLPSNEIYDLFEDKDGFLWIGTDEGVLRFDGLRMQTFNLNDGLSDKNILSIHQDSKGNIWFLTYNGKLSYWKNGKIYNEFNDQRLKEISSESYFSSFLEDLNGNLWFGTRFNGIFKIDTSQQIIHFEKRPTNLKQLDWPEHPMFAVMYSFLDTKNRVCISNIVGNLRFDGNEFELLSKFNIKQKNGRFHHKNPNLLFSSTANIITCSHINNGKIHWSTKITSAKRVNAIELLSDSLLYVATDTGVYSFDLNGKKIDSLLLGNKASDILIDREGNLWISTLDAGLFLYKNREILNFNTGAKFSILAVEDTLFFGGQDLIVHSYHQKQLKQFPIQYPDLKYPATQERILTLEKDRSNRIWIGSLQGLFELKKSTAHAKIFMGTEHLLFDKNSVFIATVNHYLLQLNVDTIKSKFPFYNSDERFSSGKKNISLAKENGLFSKAINCMLKTKENALLIGTDKGVHLLKDSFQLISQFPKGIISDLQEDNLGNIWILEKWGGLYHYKNNLHKLDTIKLFPNQNKVLYSSLKIENENNIWIGSDKGLIHLLMEEDKVFVDFIDRNSGLESNDIKDLIIKNDTIWLASSTGISLIPIKSYKDTIPPLLWIDSISNKESNHKNLSTSTLVFEDGNLNIHFTGISFKDEGNLSYEYNLSGKAQQSGKTMDRQLLLNNLPSSNYVLSIAAIDSKGNRSKQQTVNFRVQLRWWKDARYWLLIIFVLSITFSLIFRQQLKRKSIEIKDSILASRNKHIMVKSVMSGDAVKIKLNQLLYIEASRDYKELVLTNKKELIRSSMNDLMEQLKEAPEFIQVHKSYIINSEKIDAYNTESIKISDKTIPIGRTYRSAVKELYKQQNKSS